MPALFTSIEEDEEDKEDVLLEDLVERKEPIAPPPRPVILPRAIPLATQFHNRASTFEVYLTIIGIFVAIVLVLLVGALLLFN